ncbi:HoxN/HupN/NixA family nickel/cobalt transporter [Vulcanisaeta distributa]|uniref:Nickel/cobalt efflux system n=1 Tax=Vulcanisaeta distributa (strain DSM 14429 / JCM 11212 / NBRC 100878 / IC-017) TaxID=572478 RepID=E1QQS7_VULDI|nr:HoxN/HupN/NixA family nickel/cobalt transporter [Vulcanisaeta distributa]ADN51689.1 high-affinity nickel-transporter [Vulcanisaeta distributa DSM 14429]
MSEQLVIGRKTALIMGLTYTAILTATGLAWFWFYELVTLAHNAAFSSSATSWLGDVAHIRGAVTLSILGVLAYLFGLRHGLDADHLAAIDNSTRKLVQERKRSLFTGTFFSLGHSTVVILMAVALMIATRYIVKSLANIENVGSIIGTLISGGFLYIIGFLNFLVLLEIYDIYREFRRGRLDEARLEDALMRRGFMNKFFRGLFKIVDEDYYMYPIGFLFGLGFDTATEVATLAISAAVAGVFTNIPLWYLLVFPVLFTVGMVLTDTTDGFFMNYAYNWAFRDSLRKLWYNLTMTLISIMVAWIVGTLELLGLVQSEFNLGGPFWDWIALVNGETWWEYVGVIIVFTFAVTWIISYVIYRLKISRLGMGTS